MAPPSTPVTMATSAPMPVPTFPPFASSLSPTVQPASSMPPSVNYTFIDHPTEQYIVLWALLGTTTFVSIVITNRLLGFYARVDTPLAMRLVVGLTWFLGLWGVLVLLPFDLVSDFYDIARQAVWGMWETVYWVTFLMSWVVTAVTQEYHASGHFTFRSRLWDSIRVNVKTYLIIGIILLVLGAILMFTRGLTVAFFMAAANFYGMSLIVIMMGYGIAEIPLSMWRSADPARALETQEFRAGSVETRMIDAEDQVDEAADEVVAFRARLSRMPDPDVELVARAEQVLALAPRRESVGMQRSAVSSRRQGSGNEHDAQGGPAVTLHALATLHKNLKTALVAAERARWDWDDLLERTAMLEKLLQERNRVEPGGGIGDLPMRSAGRAGGGLVDEAEEDEEEGHDHGGGVVGSVASTATSVVTCNCNCVRCTRWAKSFINLRSYSTLYRLAAAVSFVLSAITLWCAVVSPFSPVLSMYGYMMSEADSPVTVWLSAFVPLMYMGMCVYTALFKFPYLDVLALHGNRQTDAYNLCYNASYMGRLQFSLGVVYFQMLRQQDSEGTAFNKLVGKMETVSFIGASFSQFSPALIIIFTLASMFSVGDRMLDYLGISTRKRPMRGVREHEERIENGRRLIQAARARRERERRRVRTMASSAATASTATTTGGYARVGGVEGLLDRL